MQGPCLLCGVKMVPRAAIEADTPADHWLSEMRLVYSRDDVVHLSGVGLFMRPYIWCAPVDWTKSWHEANDFVEVSVPPRAPMRHGLGIKPPGFALHASCFRVLDMITSARGRISLEHLMTAGEFVPLPHFTGLNWRRGDYPISHAFTIYRLDDPVPNARRDRDSGDLEVARLADSYPWNGVTPPYAYRYYNTIGDHDPTDSLALEYMLKGDIRPLPRNTVFTPHPRRRPYDVFSRLPWELLEMIAFQLPTRDALNARAASKAYFPLLYSHSFWLSRFQPDGELGFMWELRATISGKSTEELVHYARRITPAPHRPEFVLNRHRVWLLAKHVAALCAPGTEACLGVSRMPPTPLDKEQGSVMISGEEEEGDGCSHGPWCNVLTCWCASNPNPRLGMLAGCRTMSAVKVTVGPGPLEIVVGIIELGQITHVTGIRVTDGEGKSQLAGRLYGGQHGPNVVVYKINEFRGFRAAVGASGVRALQPICGDADVIMPWAGRTVEVPISDRLVIDRPVQKMRVSLDGYKVTAIELSPGLSLAEPTGHGMEEEECLSEGEMGIGESHSEVSVDDTGF